MKNFKFTISGQKYEVEIQSHQDNIINLEVNGSAYSVEIDSEVKKPAMARTAAPVSKAATPVKASAGASVVKAPLPGNIFKIFVKVGDQVEKGQKLLIMEAMKMENDILAEKPGTIKSILIHEGDAVLQGDVIIEIE